MSDDVDLQMWVSDKLHETLDMSDKHVVMFLIGLAKKTDNVDSYIEKISDVIGDNQNAFTAAARELWNKIPRKSNKESSNRIKEKLALEQQKKNASYKMLSESEEEIVPLSKTKPISKNKKKNVRYVKVQHCIYVGLS